MSDLKPSYNAFQLPSIPTEFLTQSLRKLISPDDIKVGDILMADRTLEVRVEITLGPQGEWMPKVHLDRVPPVPPGPFQVMAYEYPFIACLILAGMNKDNTLPVDVRMHHFVRVSQAFVDALVHRKRTPE